MPDESIGSVAWLARMLGDAWAPPPEASAPHEPVSATVVEGAFDLAGGDAGHTVTTPQPVDVGEHDTDASAEPRLEAGRIRRPKANLV